MRSPDLDQEAAARTESALEKEDPKTGRDRMWVQQRLEGQEGATPPSTDWERGIWDQIAARQRTARVRRIAAAAFFLAAAAVALWYRPARESEPPTIVWDVVPRSGSVRGDRGPRLGDEVQIRATGLGTHRQVRVYRDDRVLIVQCDTASPCVASEGTVSARVRLGERALFRVLVLSAAQPLPPATGDYDIDTALVLERGGLVLTKLFDLR